MPDPAPWTPPEGLIKVDATKEAYPENANEVNKTLTFRCALDFNFDELMPERGTYLEGYGVLASWTKNKVPGEELYEVEMVAKIPINGGVTSPHTEIEEPTYEVDWSFTSADLTAIKWFQDAKSEEYVADTSDDAVKAENKLKETHNTKKISKRILDLAVMYIAAGAQERAQIKTMLTGVSAPTMLDNEALDKLVKAVDKGQREYEIPIPTATKTSKYRIPAKDGKSGLPTNKCGYIDTPPAGFGDSLPDGYSWRKVADRISRQGKRSLWSRTEQWKGLPSSGLSAGWNTDYYELESESP